MKPIGNSSVFGIAPAVVLAAAAAFTSAAHAAQISVTGTHNVPQFGSAGPLGVGQAGQQSFSSGSGNDFVSGTVRFSNTAADGQQCLELTLTNFVFSASGIGDRQVSISVMQDFLIDGDVAGPATASHTMNGFVTFGSAGQLATGYTDSLHESVQLPRITFNPTQVLSSGAGQPIINRGQGVSSSVTVSGVYRMITTYVFTLNAAGSVVSVHFPDSIVDQACLVLVPLPTAAWAGLGGLMLGAGGGVVRRRRLQGV
jgi:hypothetical protein